MRLLRIVPDDTKFDFTRFRRISFPISAILSIAAIVLYLTHGLNFGIDFKGGTLLEVQSKSGPANLADMRAKLLTLNLGEVQLQEFGQPTDVLIRVGQQPGGEEAQAEAVNKVRQVLGDTVDYRRVEVVGPRVSGELLSMGIVGLFFAIGGILVYLWFRFEWQFALGAMVANVHDLVLTLGFMSLLQIDFDLTSIAALLTILGYSLNDTVVIYDRIRETLRRYKKLPMTELLNYAINSTLSRSIITHVTVSLSLLALLLFGGRAIYSFTATMMFGVVLVGTYTSIFIAAPILIYLGVGIGRAEATEHDPAGAPIRPSAAEFARGVSGAGATGAADVSTPAERVLVDGGAPHLPHAAPIEAYGKGGFRFADMSHRGSLLCLPDGIWASPVTRFEDIDEQALAPVFARAGAVTHCLIGAGARSAILPAELRRRFQEAGISVECMATGVAISTYNILLDERRPVAALLIAAA